MHPEILFGLRWVSASYRALHLYNQGEKFIFNQESPPHPPPHPLVLKMHTGTRSEQKLYKHIRQDLVYLTFKSACLVKDGIKGAAAFHQIVPFPGGPAVSFPIKIKYDPRSHAYKFKLHFPPRVHFGKTHCLQPAVSAHHSTRLLGVWCTLVASISTACIPLPSFHKSYNIFSSAPLSAPLYVYIIAVHSFVAPLLSKKKKIHLSYFTSSGLNI